MGDMTEYMFNNVFQPCEDMDSFLSIDTRKCLDQQIHCNLNLLSADYNPLVNNTPLSDEDIVDSFETVGLAVLKISKNSVTILNDVSTKNLYKELPTCNVCQKEMVCCEGKYGVFYYCGNRCKNQKTVSDKYWQSVRRIK